MKFIVRSIELITEPNYWSFVQDDNWTITDVNAIDLWGMIHISDSISNRRYVAVAGATLKVTFLRADSIDLTQNLRTLTYTTRSITKDAAFSTYDRSLVKFSITSQDAAAIVSGSAKFELKEGTKTTIWIQNWFVKKQSTTPGF
jgi:hypothetical protein